MIKAFQRWWRALWRPRAKSSYSDRRVTTVRRNGTQVIYELDGVVIYAGLAAMMPPDVRRAVEQADAVIAHCLARSRYPQARLKTWRIDITPDSTKVEATVDLPTEIATAEIHLHI